MALLGKEFDAIHSHDDGLKYKNDSARKEVIDFWN